MSVVELLSDRRGHLVGSVVEYCPINGASVVFHGTEQRIRRHGTQNDDMAYLDIKVVFRGT